MDTENTDEMQEEEIEPRIARMTRIGKESPDFILIRVMRVIRG
jgi:hypothetical protein